MGILTDFIRRKKEDAEIKELLQRKHEREKQRNELNDFEKEKLRFFAE